MYNNIVNRPLILNPEVHLSFATKSFLVQVLFKYLFRMRSQLNY